MAYLTFGVHKWLVITGCMLSLIFSRVYSYEREYTGYQDPLLLKFENSESAMLNPSVLSLDSGMEMGIVSNPYLAESSRAYISFSLGWGVRMGFNFLPYLRAERGCPRCISFFDNQEHLTATSLAYRLRNKKIQNWAEWISLGLNYKTDSENRDSWDPGLTYYSPNFNWGRLQLGWYGLGLLDHDDNIQRTTELSAFWKSPGELFFAEAGMNLYGDNLSTEMLFVDLPRTKNIGFGISPVSWLRLSYSRYPGNFTQYKLTGDWHYPNAWFHHLKLEMSGWTAERIMFVSGGIHMGLLGNKKASPIFGKKKKPEIEYDREMYNREKIGVLRGVVWPYVNTFGFYTTFLVPSGTSCLAVGCYTSAFVLMGGWLSMMVTLSTLDPEDDVEQFDYIVVFGLVGTKLIDFFIARHHVKKHNRQLKLKFKTKKSSESGPLQTGAELQAAF